MWTSCCLEWRARQQAHQQLSNNSRLIVVPKSSHFISLDQPQAVAGAIQLVVEIGRTGQPLQS